MEGIESMDKILDTIDGSSFEEVMKERNRVCIIPVWCRVKSKS